MSDHASAVMMLAMPTESSNDLAEALRRSEAIYQSLVEALPMAVMRKDHRGRIQHANSRACDFLRLPIDQIVGRTDFDLFPADLARVYAADDREVVETGKLQHKIDRHVDQQGNVSHIEVWKSPVHAEDGNVVGLQVVFWDISNHKDTEHRRDFEVFLFSTLLNKIPDSIYFKDVDSKFIRISAAQADKMGAASVQEIIGKSDADFFAPQHADAARRDEQTILRGGDPVLGRIEREIYPDGRLTWCHTTKLPLTDDDGAIIGTFGISRDVTDQIAAEHRLAEERDLLKTIINNIPDLIYIKDRAGRFVIANDAVARLYGVNDASVLIGQTDYDYVAAETACEIVADDQTVMRGGEPMIDKEEMHRRQDSDALYFSTTRVPIRSHDGRVTGVVGISRNITERRRAAVAMMSAKEAADKANRAKSDFLANMSHEIRTPMNAIIGMTELLRETPLNESQQEFLAMVADSADSLLAVINDVLDFSKIEAGRLDIDHTTFDVRKSLGDTIKMLGVRAHAAGIELAFRIAPEVPRYAIGDAGRLRQVLINLVGNAIKFTPEGEVVVEITVGEKTDRNRQNAAENNADKILPPDANLPANANLPPDANGRPIANTDFETVERFGVQGIGRSGNFSGANGRNDSHDQNQAGPNDASFSNSDVGLVHQPDHWVLQVEVRDTGIGIDDDAMGTIFEEFRQADSSTTRRFGGTGLGLAIASRLVTLMGGRINVKSTPNVGSQFTFTAQLGHSDQSVPEHIAKGSVIVGGTDILVVDDNATNRFILKEMLSNWGMNPTIVADGSSALEELENRRDDPFGLIISDINMPEMSGYEMLDIASSRKLTAQTPVLVLTSSGREGDLARCRHLGIASRLMKPVKQSELFDAIVMALGVNMAEDAKTSDRGQPTPRQVEPRRILVVEDNVVNQKLAVNLLELDGHDVTVASDGQFALDLITEGEVFDLILMDVQMPRLDGYQAAAKIRHWEAERSAPPNRIVAMTAHAMSGDRQRCLASGMDDYITKPVRIESLRERIEAVATSQTNNTCRQSSDRRDDNENLEDHNMQSSTKTQPPVAAKKRSSTDNHDVCEDNEFFALGLSNVGGDRQMYAELLSLYVREATEIEAKMNRAVNSNDFETCPRLLHTLKGASMSVGLSPVVKQCGKHEDLGDDDAEQWHRVIKELHATLCNTRQRIEHWLAHHKSRS